MRTFKGIAAVIADGVSSAEADARPAELCVQSFLSDYYSTPDSWAVKHAARGAHLVEPLALWEVAWIARRRIEVT